MGLFLWVQSISGWHLNGHVTIPSHRYRTENQCTGTYVVIMSQNLLTNDYLILEIGWQKRKKIKLYTASPRFVRVKRSWFDIRSKFMKHSHSKYSKSKSIHTWSLRKKSFVSKDCCILFYPFFVKVTNSLAAPHQKLLGEGEETF